MSTRPTFAQRILVFHETLDAAAVADLAAGASGTVGPSPCSETGPPVIDWAGLGG